MELTNPSIIREIRKKFDFEFKKSFGQNFLTSQSVLRDICTAVSGSDGVIEIGPGFGTLTAALAECSKKVLAIELDSRLEKVLSYTLSDYNNVEVLIGDCMRLDLSSVIEGSFKGMTVSVAANLPYYITTPIVSMLLESKLPLEKIVVMVQKEVAQRFAAAPGGKDYSAISVLCGYYTMPRIISNVPSSCFVPQPKVDSAVVEMTVRKEKLVSVLNEKMLFRVVKAAFSQRRKTLLNCLNSSFSADKQFLGDSLLSIGIEPSRRGETLSLEEFALIADMAVREGLA